MEDTSLLATRIKDFLQKQNISAKKFSNMVGVDLRTATSWIDGQKYPNTEHLARLAEIMLFSASNK